MNDKSNQLKNEIIELRQIINNSNNIVFLGGAGVSTGSGIPDFRSENGVYRTRQQYGFAPEVILSRTFFLSQMALFYDFYKNELVHQDKQPNAAHDALVKLEHMGKLKTIVTQNIDGLHEMAGSQHVLALHGSIYRNYCMACHKVHDLSHIMRSEGIPKCLECGGRVRPDVVLYEEGLDEQILDRSIEAVKEAEVLIIGGTSLNVYPAAGLLRYFQGSKLILINKGDTPYDEQVDLLIRGNIESVLDQAVAKIQK